MTTYALPGMALTPDEDVNQPSIFDAIADTIVVDVKVTAVPNVPGHRFENPTADTPEVCQCGAAFYDGYNLHVVKVAHLRAVNA